MSSFKQKQANRLNAQKSTGPRTLQGKAVSRVNALKTGIDAVCRIIPGEDPCDLDNLAEEYHQRWQPALPEHRVLVDILAHGEWLLRRLHKAEAHLWRHHRSEGGRFNGMSDSSPLGAVFERGAADFIRLQRRMDSTERSFYHALEKLECIADLAEPADEQPQTPAPPARDERFVDRSNFPDLFEPMDPPAPPEELPDLFDPIDGPERPQQPPDPHKPVSKPVSQPNPGIGFVPSVPAATSARPVSSLPRPSSAAVFIPKIRVPARDRATEAPKPPKRA